jgi:cobalt-zinc-cadmium efflux system protein
MLRPFFRKNRACVTGSLTVEMYCARSFTNLNVDKNMFRNMKRVENIRTAALLNILFTLLELFGGLWTNSLSILSDALHDFGDSLTLTTSWLLERKSTAPPDVSRTFGYQRLSLLSAIVSSLVLFTGTLLVLSRAIPRLLEPEKVNSSGMIGIAVIGIVLNGFSFLRLKSGESESEKVLSWHLLEDVLGWLIVLLGSVVIYSIPKHINLSLLNYYFFTFDGVSDVQDLHVWSLEGETDILTVHLIIENGFEDRAASIKSKIRSRLHVYHIEHSTLETHLSSEEEFDDDRALVQES